MYYLFDGSYAGFLCCVFESFERKEWNVIPLTPQQFAGDFFRDKREIYTDSAKARRVQDGLQEKAGMEKAKDFFRAFLSEDEKAWSVSFKIITAVFKTGVGVLENFGDTDVLYFAQTLKKVSRERHRMKAFIRFQKSNDGMYFALIEPDFNVLPLISDFFRKRYADQPWLIYDVKRKYGLLYNKVAVSEVALSPEQKQSLTAPAIAIALDEEDEKFQRLWQQYFKSTNIEARKNLKLHLQHVPKRYWKYLVEKQG
ncbi:MAG TPA: TIGR03915 family putative DNA repair protein [Niabella sp.]|nr:TIGR03915 family putative DNA repair protein [Niabella sp.]